jgi:5-methylcytosine-specific restriction endonuclease McrA
MKPQPRNKAARPPQTKDKRSAAAAQYRQWYKTAEWQDIRRQRFAMEPYCRYCTEAGRTIRAISCDHVIPHRGDRSLFFDINNTASLCGHCHDSRKQRAEVLGYDPAAIGIDGLPTDPNHPFNR